MSDKRRREQERVLEEIVQCEEGKRDGEEERKDAEILYGKGGC